MTHDCFFQSTGMWPANAIYDVNEARNILCDRNFVGYDFVLVTTPTIMRSLKDNISTTGRSYLEYLIENNIINSAYEVSEHRNHEATLYATKGGWPLMRKIECLEIINPDSLVKILEVNTHYHTHKEDAKND